MAIFPLAPDQTIAQMWSNGVRGGFRPPVVLALSDRKDLDLASGHMAY